MGIHRRRFGSDDGVAVMVGHPGGDVGVFASVCCPCCCELGVDRNACMVEMGGDVVQSRGWFHLIEVGSLAL